MVTTKKKILVFVDWYLPGYKAGGPIRSIANMCARLKEDYDFRIVTSDTDLHETTPYPDVKKDSWTKAPDGTDILYISASQRRYKTIRHIITEERADIIYLNSVFSKTFTLFPLMIRKSLFPNRKVVLAPRGMLGEGALNIKSGKKKLFLFWSKLTGLYNNVRWHASSEAEVAEVKKIFGNNAKCTVALNLSQKRELKTVRRRKEQDKMKMAFLSRISYKKNLTGTLELLHNIPSDKFIEFDIYGPVEDPDYWGRCEELIRKMPKHIHVQYKGAIPNEKVSEIMQQYHLSILLTFNENFGHSIIESMAAGCPVLISDQTPWKRLSEKKAGWDFALSDKEGIQSALMQMTEMDQSNFDNWSDGALLLASGIVNHPESIEQHRTLFA